MAMSADALVDGSLADEIFGPPRPQGDYASAARTGLTAYTRHFELNRDNPDNNLPSRPCTAVITPRCRYQSSEIFTALEEADIDPSSIGCVQRKSSGEVILTFHTRAMKEHFISKCAITVNNNNKVAIQDADHRLTFLNVYDAPHELPDSAIINRLAPYCEVLSHRRGKFTQPERVFNGIRHYRVRVFKPIPSYLRFGRLLIALKHEGQQETCRHCNQPGHYANRCPNLACYNCDGLGHQASTSTEPVLCSICKDPVHRARTCPFSWDRSVIRVEPTSSDVVCRACL